MFDLSNRSTRTVHGCRVGEFRVLASDSDFEVLGARDGGTAREVRVQDFGASGFM